MIRFKFLFIYFMFIGSISIAQNEYIEKIKLTSYQYAKATKEHKFKEIVNLTYPKLVKLINRDTLLERVSNQMVSLQKEALRYKSITYKDPNSFYTLNNTLYCIVPQVIIYKNSQGETTVNTFLFATSEDQGKTWYFMTDTQFLQHKNKLFEKLDSRMKIPKNKIVFKRHKNITSLFDNPN